jgi:uncharacterized membrane-anchored protein
MSAILSSRPARLAILAVAVAQSLAVGWMVWDRVGLLRSGREITATVVPVDPRDLFRGDYVVLGYGFSAGPEIALPPGSRKGDKVYALLRNTAPAEWQLASVSAAHPGATGESEVVLKAIVDYARIAADPSEARVGRLRYGIESYYVPEDTGRALEKQVIEKRIEAVLAVGRGGDVAIKGLKVDGRLVAEEPAL